MNRLVFTLVAGVVATSVSPLLAHHSFGAEYDANKPISITGTVTKIEWTNPHSHFYLDVKDKDGKVTNWKMEGYPPNVLYRTGWKKDITMEACDVITVTGRRARDGGTADIRGKSLYGRARSFSLGHRRGREMAAIFLLW